MSRTNNTKKEMITKKMMKLNLIISQRIESKDLKMVNLKKIIIDNLSNIIDSDDGNG